MSSFQELNLISPILKALDGEGYSTPTPIQTKAIPYILNKKDLLACAQTGTGKTAAFALPILQLVTNKIAESKETKKVRALILTPTRELAIQIGESFATYGKYLRVKHAVIYGGVSQKTQVDKIQHGVDILIATPGRLLDLINQRYIRLSTIDYFVLDEADRMLDMGFINDVKKILPMLPSTKQSLFFSATLAPEIKILASSILVDPEKVEVTPVSSTAETVAQTVYYVEKLNKKHLLVHVLDQHKIEGALVFTRTKHGADRVVRELERAGIKAEAIHGDKSQFARQKALSNFKNGYIRVLVATDIAARGIDIDKLSHVINYDIPNEPATYVHRIGRTGRAGCEGKAISFCESEERPYLYQVNKLTSQNIPIVEDHPFVSNVPVKAPGVSVQVASSEKKKSTNKTFSNWKSTDPGKAKSKRFFRGNKKKTDSSRRNELKSK